MRIVHKIMTAGSLLGAIALSTCTITPDEQSAIQAAATATCQSVYGTNANKLNICLGLVAAGAPMATAIINSGAPAPTPAAVAAATAPAT